MCVCLRVARLQSGLLSRVCQVFYSFNYFIKPYDGALLFNSLSMDWPDAQRPEHFCENAGDLETRNSQLLPLLGSSSHGHDNFDNRKPQLPYRSAEPQCSCSSMLGGLPSLPWLEAPCRAEAWRSAWRSTRSM